MKYKTTAKAIREAMRAGERVVSIGYCGAQTLLRGHEPIAYTCGTYGWNFDVYNVYGLTICTGYRGMPGRTANNVRIYEQAAQEAMEHLDWEEAKAEIERLLAEFCEQA